MTDTDLLPASAVAVSGDTANLIAQNQRIIQLLENIQASAANPPARSVKVNDFNMPFGALVGLMIKIAIAAIPAAIILGLIALVISAIFSALGFAALSALGG